MSSNLKFLSPSIFFKKISFEGAKVLSKPLSKSSFTPSYTGILSSSRIILRVLNSFLIDLYL